MKLYLCSRLGNNDCKLLREYPGGNSDNLGSDVLFALDICGIIMPRMKALIKALRKKIVDAYKVIYSTVGKIFYERHRF